MANEMKKWRLMKEKISKNARSGNIENEMKMKLEAENIG
jgi:hypothetical protein